jgi:hypothetical protein
MEDPATWGQAEKIVRKVLREDYASRRQEQPVIGLSLARRITDALREAGLLPSPDAVAKTSLLGKRVLVTLEDEIRSKPAYIAKGTLLAFGEMGEAVLRDDSCDVIRCWPMLDIREEPS